MIVKNLIKFCSEPTCMEKIIFIFNPQSKKMVPVDYSSLSTDELKMIEYKGKEFNANIVLCYNNAHHISHFTTCKKPNLFSSKRKEKE